VLFRSANFVVWDTDEPGAIPYRVGAELVAEVWVNGQRVAPEGAA
jgi:imidazolonepropionase-like amidohydrolase